MEGQKIMPIHHATVRVVNVRIISSAASPTMNRHSLPIVEFLILKVPINPHMPIINGTL